MIARGVISQFIQIGCHYLLDIEKNTNEVKITTLSLLEQKKNFLKEKYE